MLAFAEYAYGSAGYVQCFEIRRVVFVEEQSVPIAEEHDAFDALGRHFLATHDNKPVATARLLVKTAGVGKITRVAVIKAARGQGVGAALMRHVESKAGLSEFSLDAQVAATAFYESLGYGIVSDVFMEAGIAHVSMRKQLILRAL